MKMTMNYYYGFEGRFLQYHACYKVENGAQVLMFEITHKEVKPIQTIEVPYGYELIRTEETEGLEAIVAQFEKCIDHYTDFISNYWQELEAIAKNKMYINLIAQIKAMA